MISRSMLVAAMLSVLAACGGGGGGTSSPPTRVTLVASGPVAPVGGGDTAQFDLTVHNATTATVSNVGVALTLGNGLTRTGVACTASGGAACPSDANSLAVASLPANGSLHFVIDAMVGAGLRGPIASIATLATDGQAPVAADQVSLAVQAFSADVHVAAQASAPTLASGGPATYTVTVTNAGPDTASNLRLENDLDTHLAPGGVTCAAEGGAACPATPGARMVAPTLPVGGQLVFTVQATVAANAIGTLASTFYAMPFGDPSPADNLATASATTTIDPSGGVQLITLQSDAGDPIGAGKSYAYSTANAKLSVVAAGGQLTVGIVGNDNWSATFAEPTSMTTLQPGTYDHLTRATYSSPTTGAIDWSGNGTGCNTTTGSFTIESVTYSAGSLASLDMHFEQHCEDVIPALRGHIHWVSGDATRPAGPASPAPGWLWRAPASATPASGNYMYLQSDAGDYIGGGATHLYTQANADIHQNLGTGHLSFNAFGDDSWTGDFQAMDGLAQLQPGYYANLKRYPFHNPTMGGLSLQGDDRGCNELTGWFVIDNITIAGGGVLAAVDLRFEQHCEGGGPALRGQIHWTSGDTSVPPGPQSPPPATLWRAPVAALPASGNYVYLQSDPGDYIGGGLTTLLTPADGPMTATTMGTVLDVSAGGGSSASEGVFQAMDSLTQLEPGYYPGLQRYPFNNHATGGLSWTGGDRGCNTLSGWFVIDSISYSAGALASVDLRFEQHCEGVTPALHGQVHWVAP